MQIFLKDARTNNQTELGYPSPKDISVLDSNKVLHQKSKGRKMGYFKLNKITEYEYIKNIYF